MMHNGWYQCSVLIRSILSNTLEVSRAAHTAHRSTLKSWDDSCSSWRATHRCCMQMHRTQCTQMVHNCLHRQCGGSQGGCTHTGDAQCTQGAAQGGAQCTGGKQWRRESAVALLFCSSTTQQVSSSSACLLHLAVALLIRATSSILAQVNILTSVRNMQSSYWGWVLVKQSSRTSSSFAALQFLNTCQ